MRAALLVVRWLVLQLVGYGIMLPLAIVTRTIEVLLTNWWIPTLLFAAYVVGFVLGGGGGKCGVG